MTLQLNDEQLLIKQSAEQFIEREYTFEQRRHALASDSFINESVWAQMAELGWLGAGLAEASGGFGGGPIEHMVICEALGRAMVLEPFVSTAVIGARALELADDASVATPLVEKLIEGKYRLALAYAEQGTRFEIDQTSARVQTQGNSTVINGTKIAVMDAPSANALIVSAKPSDADAGRVGLYLVDLDTPGVEMESYRAQDGRPCSTVRLDNAQALTLIDPERGVEALQSLVDHAAAARCAEVAGAMQAAFEQTVDYLKQREQFGVPLGSFQVIQHRLVDLLMYARECQAKVLMTAVEIDGANADERLKAVSAAKVYIGKRARKLGQEIVQLHGGIGMTEELPIGHFFRYLTQFCSTYGSSAHHLTRYVNATAKP